MQLPSHPIQVHLTFVIHILWYLLLVSVYLSFRVANIREQYNEAIMNIFSQLFPYYPICGLILASLPLKNPEFSCRENWKKFLQIIYFFLPVKLHFYFLWGGVSLAVGTNNYHNFFCNFDKIFPFIYRQWVNSNLKSWKTSEERENK